MLKLKYLKRRGDAGFSLIEIVTVAAIIAILAAIAIPAAVSQRKKGIDVTVKTDLLSLSSQVESLISNWHGVPPATITISSPNPATPTIPSSWAIINGGVTYASGTAANSGSVVSGTIWSNGAYCVSEYNPTSSDPNSSTQLLYRSDTKTFDSTNNTCAAAVTAAATGTGALGGVGTLPTATSVTTLGQVTNLTPTSAQTNTISASWSAVAGATGYTVQVSGMAPVTTTSTSVTISNVAPGSQTVAVSAYDATGNNGPKVSQYVTVTGSNIITGGNLFPTATAVGTSSQIGITIGATGSGPGTTGTADAGTIKFTSDQANTGTWLSGLATGGLQVYTQSGGSQANNLSLLVSGTTVNGAFNVVAGKTTVAASTTSNAAINIPIGAVPTSSVTGDLWTTSSGLSYQSSTGTKGLAYSDLSNVAGGTLGQILVSNGGSIATWQALSLSTGLPTESYKTRVKVATTALIALTGTQTIDGIAVVAGDRVLVKNQSTASANGIYTVAVSAWSRSSDANTSAAVSGDIVEIDQGATNGGVYFTTNFKSTDILDSTSMVWSVLGGGTVTGSQTANTIYAAPNGSSGLPTFRTLANADLGTILTPQLASLGLGTPAVPSILLSTGGTVTGTIGTGGLIGSFNGSITNNAAASTTTAIGNGVSISGPAINSTNVSNTITDAASLYLAGGPTAGTNTTISNAWALLSDGNVKVNGNVFVTSETAKTRVKVATTATITLSGTQTIDGIAVVAGDRVLVKDQATATNGIYIVAAAGWARATDADTTAKLSGALVGVDQGTVNGATVWKAGLKGSDTLGTTSYTWSNVGAGAGVTNTNDISTNATNYPLFASVSSNGALTNSYTSNTKYTFNPSSGTLSATALVGTSSVTTNGFFALTSPTSIAATTYTVSATDNNIIINTSSATTLTLPAANTSAGRVLNIKNTTAFAVTSASSNIVAINGGAAGTAILPATAGSWVTLTSDGSSWIITANSGSSVAAVLSGTNTWTALNTFSLGLSSANVTTTGYYAQTVPVTPASGLIYTVGATDNDVILIPTSPFTLTLPAAASFSGRILTVSTTTAFTVTSASANVVAITGGAAGTAILPAVAGAVVVLESNGTNWIVIDGSSGSTSITNDISTNATEYPLFANASSGLLASAYTSSAGYTFNPSSGLLTAPLLNSGNLNVTSSSIPANGVYLSAANQLSLSSNSTARLNITSSGQVGFNVLPVTGRAFSISNTLTGGTTAYGTFNSNAVQSDVTSQAVGLYSYFSNQNTPFTLANFDHIFLDKGTISTGTAVTTMRGFNAGTNWGGTNNYGFYGPLAANASVTVTAATGAAGTVTYTATNTFSPGQTVTITGLGIASGASLNLTSVVINAATSTQFTVLNAAVGVSSGTGSALTTANYWNLYLPGSAANYLAGQTTVGSTSLLLGNNAGVNNTVQQFGVVSTQSSNIAQVIRGATSQTGDLLQAQDSTGALLANITSTGRINAQNIGFTAGGYTYATLGTTGDTGGWRFETNGVGNKGVSIRGSNGQTADLFQIQDYTGSVLDKFNATGGFTSTTDATINGLTIGLGGGSSTTNSALGRTALLANTTGTLNTAVGSFALGLNQGGANNSALGYNALTANVGGNSNTAVGQGSLQAASSGSTNTAVGASSLLTLVSGLNNTAVGNGAGQNVNAASSNNIFLGTASGPASAGAVSNQLYIGNIGTPGTASGTALIAGVQGTTNANSSVTLNGVANASSGVASTTSTTGALVVTGGVGISGDINAASTSSLAVSGITVSPFTGGSWINLPTSGPSGIGTGGAGSSPFVAYTSGAAQWFSNAVAGDVVYRNTGGRLLFGNTAGSAASMVLASDALTLTNRLTTGGVTSTAASAGVTAITAKGAASQTADLLQFQNSSAVILANIDANGNATFPNLNALRVKVATTATLAASTYANGTAGVGATLTESANGVLAAIDAYTPVVGDRVLVANQASNFQNGIYTVTSVGSAGTPWVLTRATDADTTAKLAVLQIGVDLGTTNASTFWKVNTKSTDTIGTTAMVWTQVISGTGASLSGTNTWTSLNTFSAGLTTSSLIDQGSFAAKGPSTVAGTAYSQATNDFSLIFSAASTTTVTLLSAATYPGQVIHVKNIGAGTVVSASSNVVPQSTATAGTAILAAGPGKWAMLQSDGTNWVVMMSN
jgi:prepilin-type N-terminal cleavage/methylation domain-containing protein